MKNVKPIFMKRKKEIAILTVCIITIIFAIFLSYNSLADKKIRWDGIAFELDEKKDYIFLSDLNYITDNDWSYNGWSGHNIQKDKNQEGGVIKVVIGDEIRPYSKGMSVHARGQITYDISEYSVNYPRFTAKIGVDASRGTNGSVWFEIFVSHDGVNWTSLLKTDNMNGTTAAVDVDLDIEGYNYLRIYVDPNGVNSSDHGVIANARFVTEDFENKDIAYDRIQRLEYYDEILNAHDADYNYTNNYRFILEREFVRKIGYWVVQDLADVDPKAKRGLDWILDNNRVLEEVIEVSEIGNTTKFIQIISDLYSVYKEDLKTENGYVYEKMIIGLAAAYTTDRLISPLSFGHPVATYDYISRFGKMKDLFDNHKFSRMKTNVLNGEMVENEWFKDYHVELMRMIFQDATSDIDLVWLNGYTQDKQNVNFRMIPYVKPNYVQAKFYDEANRDLYDNKYYLSKYNVPYGDKIARFWMVIENGGICWNASRFGQSMYRVNGIPATGGYQPGHELYIQYYEDNNGNGYWTPRYGNWGWAGSTWGGSNPYRYIFNWGNKYFADRHISGSKGASSTGYLYLGQANLNRLEQYKKSLYYNLTANSYSNNNQKLATYRKALEINDLNLDTYDNLITLYKAMSVQNEGGTITAHDWYELANKVIDAYRFYPVAMFDLLKVIRPYLEGSEKLYVDRLEKETLQRASRATAEDTIQVDGVRTHANQLLNKAQPDPITFSFDGENGGKLVKNPMYSLAWGYSLDGGNTYTSFETDDAIALTTEELARITPENDIIINFMGLKDYTFRIDITKGTLSNLLYANDLENRVVGIDLAYEWRNSESDSWTSYKVASPDNTGNKTLFVRKSATSQQVASDVAEYHFTDDNQPNTRKYVAVSHLTISDFSTESVDTARPYYAVNAIDGNANTLWHTDFRENVLDSEIKPYITIKLDKPRYISAVEFKQLKYRSNDPIYAKNTRIYISEDGDKWIEAGRVENSPQNEELRVVDFAESIYGEYIKIEMDTYGIFTSLSLVNVFQDITKQIRPTAGVGYSTTEPTNGSVIARLVNVSVPNYEIISEGGDTHVFTENNQEFTFRFRDKDSGLEGSTTAKVTWIDKIAPTAKIEYSTLNSTNSSVYATLKPSEDVKILNNGYYRIDEDGKVYDNDNNLLEDYTVDEKGVVKDGTGKIIDPFKYEFIDNGEFTFEFVDKAGNYGTATAKVNWIDYEAPLGILHYDITKITNKDVNVSIEFNENATVMNNNGSKTYTFTDNGEFTFIFRDSAGNTNTLTASVNWIDKVVPTAELKYEKYEDKVVVRVVNASKEITFKEGIGIYEFIQNGTYEIVFYDKAGNEGKLVAVIDSLKQNNNDDNKPSVPDKPDDSNNSNDSNQSESPSDNNGNSGNLNNGSKLNTNKPGTTRPVNLDYKSFVFKGISVGIPSNVITEEATLKVEDFTIPNELKDRFGSKSEFYDIYLTNAASNRLNINSSSLIKISMKLNELKEFVGVFEVTDDNTVKPVKYEKNGNSIEISANSLGRYVVSYKEEGEVIKNEEINSGKNPEIVEKENSKEITKENKRDSIIWGIIAACIVIMLLSVYLFKIKKKTVDKSEI